MQCDCDGKKSENVGRAESGQGHGQNGPRACNDDEEKFKETLLTKPERRGKIVCLETATAVVVEAPGEYTREVDHQEKRAEGVISEKAEWHSGEKIVTKRAAGPETFWQVRKEALTAKSGPRHVSHSSPRGQLEGVVIQKPEGTGLSPENHEERYDTLHRTIKRKLGKRSENHRMVEKRNETVAA